MRAHDTFVKTVMDQVIKKKANKKRQTLVVTTPLAFLKVFLIFLTFGSCLLAKKYFHENLSDILPPIK